MDFYEMLDAVNSTIESFIADNTERVSPEEMGLDKRAGYKLFVNEDVIAVDKSRDRGLQYYGGFEYVEAEYRTELGEYVFYSVGDERVQEHIQKWLEGK